MREQPHAYPSNSIAGDTQITVIARGAEDEGSGLHWAALTPLPSASVGHSFNSIASPCARRTHGCSRPVVAWVAVNGWRFRIGLLPPATYLSGLWVLRKRLSQR
jgi:hypothetical protein